MILPRNARQARRLTLRVLVETFRTIVARQGIGIIACSVFAFGTTCAFDPRRVAELPRSAGRTPGATFRVRELPGGAQGTACGLRGLAHLADRAHVAGLHARLVAKLARNAWQA